MAKVPAFSCRCKLSQLPARARQVAEARAVRLTDVVCTLGLGLLLVLASCCR